MIDDEFKALLMHKIFFPVSLRAVVAGGGRQ